MFANVCIRCFKLSAAFSIIEMSLRSSVSNAHGFSPFWFMATNKVSTKDMFERGFIITQVVKGADKGMAYQLTRLDGRVLKSLISHDRLKLDTSTRREDFDDRYPVTQDQATNSISEAVTGVNSVNDSGGGVEHSSPQQQDNNVTADTNSNRDGFAMEPAIKILREKALNRLGSIMYSFYLGIEVGVLTSRLTCLPHGLL